MDTKRKLSAIVVGALVTGGLAFGGASAAQAAGPNHNVGPFQTKSECNAKKAQYVSSWTKISQNCTHYKKQGGFTAEGWYFHYRSVV